MLSFLPIGFVSAQSDCGTTRLDEAQTTYDLGLFVVTLDLLRPCVPDGFLEDTDKRNAFRLMALSYVTTDSLENARLWVSRLLDIDPVFRPDAERDPPLFIDYVDTYKPRWYTWIWNGNEWYKWIGRSMLLGGVVSVPLLLRDTPEPPLPGYPGFPNR